MLRNGQKSLEAATLVSFFFKEIVFPQSVRSSNLLLFRRKGDFSFSLKGLCTNNFWHPFFWLKILIWVETMIPQRKIVSDTCKMVLLPHLPPPPTVSPPPPTVSTQNQLHLRAKSLLQKLFQTFQVTVPIFFYFDVISKIRPLEPKKTHIF